jgi:radical SAM enzyme (TIGR01210 family)
LYTTPWLWSIVEIVKRVKNPGKLIVGLFKFFPSPSAVPNNCELCNDKVMTAIIKYNKSLDRSVFDGLDCECKSEWEKTLEEAPQLFEERLKPIPVLLEELKKSFLYGERANNSAIADNIAAEQ